MWWDSNEIISPCQAAIVAAIVVIVVILLFLKSTRLEFNKLFQAMTPHNYRP